MKRKRIILILATIGVIFSGYLSYSKLVMKTCAIDQSCPVFLGISACYFGFGFFLILLILSIVSVFASVNTRDKVMIWIFFVSLLGSLFALYITYDELVNLTCPLSECGNKLYFPSCSYGLIMFLSIFILSIFSLKKLKHNTNA